MLKLAGLVGAVETELVEVTVVGNKWDVLKPLVVWVDTIAKLLNPECCNESDPSNYLLRFPKNRKQRRIFSVAGRG